MLIGEEIKKRRIQLGLSKAELSEKTGISNSYISMLESGDRRSPSLDILLKISNALDYDFTDDKILNSDFRKSTLNSIQQFIYDSFCDFLTCINLESYWKDMSPEDLCDIALSNELSAFLIGIKNKDIPLDYSKELSKLNKNIKKQELLISDLKKELEIKNKTINGLLDSINKIDNLDIQKIDKNYNKIKSYVEKKFPILENEIEFFSNPKVEAFFNFNYKELSEKGFDDTLIKALEESIFKTLKDIDIHYKGDDNNGNQEK